VALGGLEHVKGLAKGQITHDVEGPGFEPSCYVGWFAWTLMNEAFVSWMGPETY
jgi:hypothetical protein